MITTTNPSKFQPTVFIAYRGEDGHIRHRSGTLTDEDYDDLGEAIDALNDFIDYEIGSLQARYGGTGEEIEVLSVSADLHPADPHTN